MAARSRGTCGCVIWRSMWLRDLEVHVAARSGGPCGSAISRYMYMWLCDLEIHVAVCLVQSTRREPHVARVISSCPNLFVAVDLKL